MKMIKVIYQIGLLTLFYLAGEGIARIFNLKIPGSIIGLMLLFFLLRLKVVKISWIEAGAGWLLAELLLFFVPSAIGIIQYKTLMINDGIKIFAVIILSLSLVMLTGGVVTDYLISRRQKGNDI